MKDVVKSSSQENTLVVEGGKDSLVPLRTRDRDRLIFLGLVLLTMLSSIPLLQTNMVFGHDTVFHVLRIEAIAQELANGQFPVRIETTQLEGYGYASGIMYGSSLLYIPALFRIAGLPLDACLTLYLCLINICTILIAYVSFYKIFGKRSVAFTCTALWVLQLYRLTCMYTRGALGECTALMFLPLLAWGVYALFQKNDKDWDHRFSWLIITFGLSGMIQSHTITTEITVIALLIIGIILLIKRHRWAFTKLVLKSVCVTLLVNLWFIVPFVDFYLHADLHVTHWFPSTYAADNAIDVEKLFLLFSPMLGQSFPFKAGLTGEMMLCTGWPLLTGLIAWAAILVVPKWRTQTKRLELFSLGNVMAIGSLLFLWMASSAFIWFFAYSGDPILEAVIGFFALAQFPWRYLTFAALFLALLAGVILILLYQHNIKLTRAIAAIIVVFACVCGGAFMTPYLYESESKHGFSLEEIRFESNYGVINGEYLGHAAGDPNELDLITEPEMDSGLIINEYQKKGTWIGLDISWSTRHTEAAQILLPLYYYPGYIAVDQETNEQLTLESSEDGRIALTVPPDHEGKVVICFVEPWYWQISNVISGLTILVIMVWAASVILTHKRLKMNGEAHD